MKLLWQTYYKMKLGSSYETVVNNATLTKQYTTNATTGKISIFYNDKGELIRGWHKAPARFNKLNPLVEYYSSK